MALDTITIQTTQNVNIDYDLAKTGSRIGAFLIDGVIVLVGYGLVAYCLEAVGVSFGSDANLILWFPTTSLILYGFLLENFNQGRTLGKQAVGLKVIRADGRDPTPGDFLARAMFLLVDVLFSSGMIAVLLVATGKNKQRLGDLTAGTVVILANTKSIFSLQEIMGIKNREEHETTFPGVQRFTDEDMMVVKQTLTRARKYNNPAHRRALRQLSLRIAGQLELDAKGLSYSPEQFLETVLLDYIVITR